MNIKNKIEEIRQKPEHIRLRYVWAMMAISMLCILFVWFFSFLAEEKSISPSISAESDPNIENMKQSQQEIQGAASGMKQTLDSAKNQIQSGLQEQGQ
ncbi:MAG: hypothetical protein HGB08_00010 [Candidatus Moranbacteria bacterium]|nr:hypothetical protein [Candidatus Moranbacteria bacterium]